MRKKYFKQAVACMLALGVSFNSVPVYATNQTDITPEEVIEQNESTEDEAEYEEGQVIIQYYESSVKASKSSDPLLLGPGITIVDSCVFEDAGDLDNSTKSYAAGGSASAKDLVFSLVESDEYTTAELVEILESNSSIVSVQPNYKIHVLDMESDPYEKYQWAIDNTGQNGGTEGLDANASHLEGDGDGTERVIALVDTGMDYTHEDLKDVVWNNTAGIEGLGEHGYDCINNDSDPMDDQGHGSHCAGIMAAAGANGVGIKGIAQSSNIKIMPLKILDAEGYGDDYSSITAYNKIYTAMQNGVNIVAINNSWGNSVEDNTSSQFVQLVEKVGQMGALSICAAGNDGEDNDSVVSFPANADSEYVISVAASNEKDELAGFSNYGKKNVDLASPGANILSTVCTDTFNPSIYEDKDSLCETYQDFEDGNLVQTVGQNATGETAQEGDIEYGFYAKESSSSSGGSFPGRPSSTTAASSSSTSAQLSVELSSDTYFGEAKGKSLKWSIKNAVKGASYCLYLPYSAVSSNTEQYDSLQVKAQGPTGYASSGGWFGQSGQNYSALFVLDSTISSDGSFDLNNYKYLAGNYTDMSANYWNHFAASTETSFSDGQERAIVLYLQNALEGDYSIYIDDVGISKANVNSSQFGKYDYYNGTSMATPYVTGAIAAMANACPSMTALDIKGTLLNNVRKNNALADKVASGGVLDLSNIKPDSSSGDNNQEEEESGTQLTALENVPTIFDGGQMLSGGDELYYVDASGKVYITQETGSNSLNWEDKSGSYQSVSGVDNSQNEAFAPESEVIYNSKKLWTVLKGNSGQRILASYTTGEGWSKETDLPDSMAELTNYTIAAYQGQIYLLGGLQESDGTISTQVTYYNAAAKAWEQAASLPEGRAFAKALQTGTELVVTLGTNGSEEVPVNLIYNGTEWTRSNASISLRDEASKYEWTNNYGQSKSVTYYDVSTALIKDGIVYVGSKADDLGSIFYYQTKSDTYQASGYTATGYKDGNIWTGVAGDTLYIVSGTDTVKGGYMPVTGAGIAVTSENTDDMSFAGTYLPGDKITFAVEEADSYVKNVSVNQAAIETAEDGTASYVVADADVSVNVEKGYYVTEIQIPEEYNVEQGGQVTLETVVLPSNADNTQLTWSSLNTGVATVDENGVVTVNADAAPGSEAEIKAVAADRETVSAICRIVVQEKTIPVESIVLSDTNLDMKAGQIVQLSATVYPEDATNKELVWESSDESVVQVIGEGLVVAAGEGNATITVSVQGGNVTAVCHVNVSGNADTTEVTEDSTTENSDGDRTTAGANNTTENPNGDRTTANGSNTTEDSNIEVTTAGVNNTTENPGGDRTTANNNDTTENPNAEVTTADVNNTTENPNGDRTTAGSNDTTEDPNAEVTTAGVNNTTENPNGDQTTADVNNTTENPNGDRTTADINNTTENSNGDRTTAGSNDTTEDPNAEVTTAGVNNTTENPNGDRTTADGNNTTEDSNGDRTTADGNDTTENPVGDNTTTENGNYIAVENISLNKSGIYLAEGGSGQLIATITPVDASNQNIRWTTSNPFVVSVDENGNVKGLQEGNALVYAITEDGSKVAMCSVYVQATEDTVIPVENIILSSDSITLKAGERQVIEVSIVPYNATNSSLVWSSDDSSIATVDRNGRVTALREGVAIITVTDADGNVSKTCVVRVEDAQDSTTSEDASATTQDNEVNDDTTKNPADSQTGSNDDKQTTQNPAGGRPGRPTTEDLSGDIEDATTEDRFGDSVSTEDGNSQNNGNQSGVGDGTDQNNGNQSGVGDGTDQNTGNQFGTEDSADQNSGNQSGVGNGADQNTGNQSGTGDDANQNSGNQSGVGDGADQNTGNQSGTGDDINQNNGNQSGIGNGADQNAGNQSGTGDDANQNNGNQSGTGDGTNQNTGNQPNAGSDTSQNNNTQSIAVTSVVLNQEAKFLATGESQYASAVVLPANATNKELAWSTSNASVATVDSQGVITAIAPGVAVITVSSQNQVKASMMVYVKPVKVTSLKKKTVKKGIKLSWKKQNRVSGYKVYKYNAKTKKYKLCKTTKTNALTLKNLKKGKTYKYKVRAYFKENAITLTGKYSKTITIKVK